MKLKQNLNKQSVEKPGKRSTIILSTSLITNKDEEKVNLHPQLPIKEAMKYDLNDNGNDDLMMLNKLQDKEYKQDLKQFTQIPKVRITFPTHNVLDTRPLSKENDA
jgi:hypothetical protein